MLRDDEEPRGLPDAVVEWVVLPIFGICFVLRFPVMVLGLMSPIERWAIGRWISPSHRVKSRAEGWYRCGAINPWSWTKPTVEDLPNRCIRFRFHLGNHYVFLAHRCDEPRVESFDWERDLCWGLGGEVDANSIWTLDSNASEFPTVACPTDRKCSDLTDEDLRIFAAMREAESRV